MKLGRVVFALMLIFLGTLLLLINLKAIDLSLNTQWPLIPILIGVGMWTGFLDNRRDWGLVIPGTILLCVGGLFYACSLIGWRLMLIWWPTFIIAPGLGLFAAYLVGERHFGLVIPAAILTSIGLIMLLQIQLRNYVLLLPVMFIAAGGLLLITALCDKKNCPNKENENREQ